MNTTDRAVGWIIIDDAAGDEGEGVVNSYVSNLGDDFKPSDSFPGGTPLVLEASGGAWATEGPELNTSRHHHPSPSDSRECQMDFIIFYTSCVVRKVERYSYVPLFPWRVRKYQV